MNKGVVISVLVLAIGFSTARAQNSTEKRPNFLLIVADDMGYSDMGMFGGEIKTPRLDQLANEGVRYTDFYVAPTCSPTRSMLLSGMDNHLAGLGNMIERIAPNQEGLEGYEGVLSLKVATLPEILKANGYHTYMAGKWHLGKQPDHIPHARGFERDFTMLDAAGSHFDNRSLDRDIEHTQFTQDGEYITNLPSDYYSTKTYTDKMIEFIESNKADGKPFFAYVAHQAPHDPIQVPDNWLRRYKGEFDDGWDELRAQRLARMKELGIVGPEAEVAPRLWYVPEWDKLTGIAQATLARKMEVYASMVEYMDMEIGRLIDYIESIGELDNTYIIFFSDNGAESRDKSDMKGRRASMDANYLARNFNFDFASWGRKGSYVAYGPPWAQVSAAPFWMFKGTVNEGGIRSPLVVVDPKHTNAGKVNNDAILHVKDVAPTLLEWAGIDQPTNINGRDVPPMQGLSWADMVAGETTSPRTDDDWLGTEWWSGKTIRQGNYKLVWMPEPIGRGGWALYDIKNDPGEWNDLAASQPDRLNQMLVLWDQYVKENNIVIPSRTDFDGAKEKLPPRPPVDDTWHTGHEPNYGETPSESDDI